MADPPMPSNRLGLRGKECSAWHSLARLDIRTGSARRCPMVRLVWALICPRLDCRRQPSSQLHGSPSGVLLLWCGQGRETNSQPEVKNAHLVTRCSQSQEGWAGSVEQQLWRPTLFIEQDGPLDWPQCGGWGDQADSCWSNNGSQSNELGTLCSNKYQRFVESCFLQDNWLFTG